MYCFSLIDIGQKLTLILYSWARERRETKRHRFRVVASWETNRREGTPPVVSDEMWRVAIDAARMSIHIENPPRQSPF
jgi:hypothetical protein